MTDYRQIPAPWGDATERAVERLEKNLRANRPNIGEVIESLAELRVAYSRDECGCKYAPPEMRPWLHAHHEPYGRTILDLLKPEIVGKVFDALESLTLPPGNHYRSAEAMRLLQEWLAPHRPPRTTGKGKYARKPKTPKEPSAP